MEWEKLNSEESGLTSKGEGEWEKACLHDTGGVWESKSRRSKAGDGIRESIGPWVNQGCKKRPRLICMKMGIVRKQDQGEGTMWEGGGGLTEEIFFFFF